jgi:hypothetical protein
VARRPSTAGKRRSSSIPPMPRPTMIWRSPTNTKGNSTRPARRTRKPSSSRPTTPRSAELRALQGNQ